MGLSVPRRALVTALAAATTLQDAATVDAVVALIEEVHGDLNAHVWQYFFANTVSDLLQAVR